jgi:hypothetical protein
MTSRLILPILALLSQTGCVAALPMAAQLMASPNASANLCSMAKMPGQTASLCDRLPFAMGTQPVVAPTAQTPHTVPGGTVVNTAAR